MYIILPKSFGYHTKRLEKKNDNNNEIIIHLQYTYNYYSKNNIQFIFYIGIFVFITVDNSAQWWGKLRVNIKRGRFNVYTKKHSNQIINNTNYKILNGDLLICYCYQIPNITLVQTEY